MATVRWRGDAQGKAQTELWAIEDALVGDKFTATCNGKDISYTLLQFDVTAAVAADASATKSQVAMDQLLALISASTIVEFAEVSYVVEDDINDRTEGITVTGDADGTDFTISLSKAASVTVEATQEGTAALNEIQKVSIGSPTGGTFTLTFDGQTTAAIAYNASANTVRDTLCNLSNILGTDEVQELTITGTPTGGTFAITYSAQTTTAIAYNASAGTVQAALEALSNIEVGDVVCAGGALPGAAVTITFRATLGRQNVALMTADGALLTGGTAPDATIATTTPGVASDVTVTGTGPWTVTFVSALALTDVVLMYGSAASLTGNGATFSSRTLQSPTGPNWWTDAENWDTGTVPVTDDTVIASDSAVPILHGLDQSAVSLAELRIYSANVGLPKLNIGGYIEYRATELAIGVNGTGASASMTVVVDGDLSLVKLNTGTKHTILTVLNTLTSQNSELPLQWRGTHASNTVRVQKGTVGVATKYGDAATIATLLMGYADSVESDANVVIGETVTLGTVTKTGGTLVTRSGADVLDHRAGSATLDGSGEFPSLTIAGGSVSSLTSGKLGAYGAITGITAANPAVVTATAHGLSDGDQIRIAGVVGMVEVNQLEFTVDVVNANSFNLVGVNSTAYTAYSSGGTWGKIGSVIVSGEGSLDFSKSAESRQVATDVLLYGNQSRVIDGNDVVSTLTRLTGQFGVKQFGGDRFLGLGGSSGSWIRQV